MAINKGAFGAFAKIQTKQHGPITQDDLLSFFEYLSTLLNSGVTLLRALTLATNQAESKKLQKVLKDITNRVSSGLSFFEAISSYPKIFQYQWAQIIRTGEVSGQLSTLLTKLNENIRKRAEITGKVKSALIYPSIMLCVAVAAIFIMLWKVIPTFAQFFTDFGKQLPPITQMILNLSNFIQNNSVTIFLVTGGSIAAFRKFIHTEFGARQFTSLLMALPVVGELVVQSAQERFTASLALLLKSGMPLLEAIKSTKEIFKENPIYYDGISEILRKVMGGSDLGTAMQTTGLFTNMSIGMVKMGEESGKLAEVLEVVAKYYEERVVTLTLRLTQLLEPVIVIGMGVVVAGMLASVYLPMFQLSSGGGR